MLRLLASRYDPVMPHLRSMLLSSIYGLANEKCKDSKATIEMIAYIVKISNDMADQCGSRPPEDVLGDILHPSMDPSSISELVHYRIGEAATLRPVDVSNHMKLRMYVQTRDARERALVPIPSRRMEVGSFAEQQQQYQQQPQEQQPEITLPSVDPSWGEPWTQVGYCQDQDHSFFAIGKGGKGGKGYEKKPLGRPWPSQSPVYVGSMGQTHWRISMRELQRIRLRQTQLPESRRRQTCTCNPKRSQGQRQRQRPQGQR